jgi:hypothetical protein
MYMDNLCAVHELPTCLEKRMAAKNQKIKSFADQCIAHPKNNSKLRNVKEEFLPANTTSVLQPMGKQIIRSLKHKRGGMKVMPPIFSFKSSATESCAHH